MYVGDEFRINELSLVPGGSTVEVLFVDGSSRIYDKIKNPNAYINKILYQYTGLKISQITVDEKVVYPRS